MFGAWWEALRTTPDRAVVAAARREEVAGIIERYEWLGNIPDNCSLYAKLTFDGNLAGALAFSRSGFGGSVTLFGEPAVKLARGVTLHWAPAWASSFLIQRALAVLFDEPIYVVAFSDWAAGEVGTVYQASGWRYLGQSMTEEWIAPDGTRRDASFHKVRVVSGSAHRRTGRQAEREAYRREEAEMLAAGWRRASSIRGKYATVAGRNGRARRRLVALIDGRAKPYPKRAGRVNGGLAGRPAQRAGFDPLTAPHSLEPELVA